MKPKPTSASLSPEGVSGFGCKARALDPNGLGFRGLGFRVWGSRNPLKGPKYQYSIVGSQRTVGLHSYHYYAVTPSFAGKVTFLGAPLTVLLEHTLPPKKKLPLLFHVTKGRLHLRAGPFITRVP